MRNPLQAIRNLFGTKPSASEVAAPVQAGPSGTAPQAKLVIEGDQADRPIGQAPLEPMHVLSCPVAQDKTKVPTLASGDTEVRPGLMERYGARAVAGTKAMCLPPMDATWVAARVLLTQTDAALVHLKLWLLRADEAQMALFASIQDQSKCLDAKGRGFWWATRGAVLFLAVVTGVILTLLLGESLHILFLDSWGHTINDGLANMNDQALGDRWTDRLIWLAPLASGAVAGLLGGAVVLLQAWAVLFCDGKVNPAFKVLFVVCDVALGAGVYVARSGSALADQALSGATIEMVVLLMQTVFLLALADALAKNESTRQAMELAEKAYQVCVRVLDGCLRLAKEARVQARAHVDAVAQRELSEYFQERDSELVKLEAEIGYLEALRDNYVAMMDPAIPGRAQQTSTAA